MIPFNDKFDSQFHFSDVFEDYLNAQGRLHVDYDGCLPPEDDSADYRRVITIYSTQY